MATLERVILEVSAASAGAVVGCTYKDQDFRALYEREYRAHQHTKAELARVRDHAAYLKKLLSQRRTEQQPSASQSAPAPHPNHSPRKHGAQPGHAAHPRKIPAQPRSFPPARPTIRLQLRRGAGECLWDLPPFRFFLDSLSPFWSMFPRSHTTSIRT